MPTTFKQNTFAAVADNCWDAVIVGGGPGGSAAAITLANAGRRVLLVEKHHQVNFKLGESLPPSSIAMLQHYLGEVDEKLLAKLGMSKITGNVSCWESDIAQSSDFFFTPPGFGLRLNRPCFDQSLRTSAEAAGVVVVEGGKLINLRRASGWQFELVEGNNTALHEAKYLIDCTGRQAQLATQLGAKRQSYDRLFAYAQLYSVASNHTQAPISPPTQTHIEACAQGWWYGAQLPNEQRLVVFHTDRDLPAAKQASTTLGFDNWLLEGQHISSWLKQDHYIADGKVKGAPAGSERLDQFIGDRWLAVGDAAQSFDPLSSQGIDKALRSGCCAAMAINQCLQAEQNVQSSQSIRNTALKNYAQEQELLWQNYQKQYFYYYQTQPRWTEQTFWQRRTHYNKSHLGVQIKKEAS